MHHIKASLSPGMKRALRWTLDRPAALTAPLRMAPEFIIIGAQKGGTTSLYWYLAEHPGVAPAANKELHFFDFHYRRGVGWYRAHFPLLWRKYTNSIQITGESSPYYLFHPHAPRRIRGTMPDVKLIALLRNPVDRAYSHYHHEVRAGHEPLSFEAALEKEEERLRGEVEKMLADEDYHSVAHQRHSYRARGLYADQLAVWLRHFPWEQFLILRSEDLYADPQAVLDQTLAFLGLPTHGIPRREAAAYKKHRQGDYLPMNPETRRRLAEDFAPHNQRLYDLLGVDFGWV